MGFGVNSYLKVKKVVEQKENYTVCQCSCSKKNKVKDIYETEFLGYVKFVGNAHKQRPMEGQKIKLTSCDVKNCYNNQENNGVLFLKQPQYLCFGYELQEEGAATNGNSKERATMYAMDDDCPIPF